MRISLYSVFFMTVLAGAPTVALAQAPAAPPAPPAQTPAEPLAPIINIIGEDFHVELQIGAWVAMPSTVQYSDTESVTSTVNGTSTTTVVNGSLVDFRSLLGMKNQVFPEGHITVKLAPRHKVRGEYIPAYFKQTKIIGADFKYNGQTYLSGQSVESTYHWTAWHAAYEFDPVTVDRGYLGGMVAGSSLNISAATANSAQSGTASVNIIMPGLGATGRYYVSGKLSVSGDFLFFYLPGNETSTHGHMIDSQFYATYNINKHAGAQIGYRFADTGHTWNSPLNTGSMTIGGPFVGGTAHF